MTWKLDHKLCGLRQPWFEQLTTVADPEFYNGGRTVEGEGSGERAMPPPQKKFEFLPENGSFWCILGLLFKIGQANGGAAAPPGSATVESLKLEMIFYVVSS